MKTERNKIKKRILSILLMFCMVASLLPTLPITAQAAGNSGSCGAALTWTLDSTGKLTISGTGDMNPYNSSTMWDKSKVKTVEIKAGVTSIGESAFEGCKSLTKVTIPEGITSIGKLAFEGCETLTSVTIPASVVSIGERAFTKCKALKSISVAAGNENYVSVDDVLFTKDMRILVLYPSRKPDTKYTIPSSVEYLGFLAFRDCTSLTEVTIPGTISLLGNYAFEGCTGLTKVDIQLGVSKLDNNTFSGCTSLKSVTIPDTVTYIGSYVFAACTSLESVTIPSSVKTLYWRTFSGCTSLSSVTLSHGIGRIQDGVFKNCTALKSVTIPSSVYEIGPGAFGGCTALTDVKFKGDAPTTITPAGDANASFVAATAKLSYIKGKAGWNTPKWQGYNTVEVAKTESDMPVVPYLYGGDSVEEGETLKYSLNATSTSPDGGTLTYQWYENKMPSMVGATKIKGATAATYTPLFGEAGTVYYCCQVTNTKDSLTPATTGTNFAQFYIRIATPKITAHPEDAEYKKGETPKALSVTATVPYPTTGTLSYQWYEKTKSSGTYTEISGATKSTYMPSTKEVGEKYYYCTVTYTKNGDTMTWNSSSARITVYPAPTITSHPKSATYTQDQPAAELSVSATIEGTPSYQWYSNTTNSNKGGSRLSGATSNTYKPPTAAIGTKYYYCEVTDTKDGLYTSIASNTATITVTEKSATISAVPTITAQPKSADYNKGEAAAVLSVTAKSDDGGTLSYQWYKNSANNNTGGTKISGATSATYRPPTDKVETAYYYCVVTNTKGSLTPQYAASSVAAITVKMPTYAITVTGGTASHTTASAGTTVTVTATVPAGKVFDKWTVDKGSTPVTITGADKEKATFIMPEGAVKVTANYKDVFAITVTSGTASPATAAEGDRVTVTANPAPAGKIFDKWTVDAGSAKVTFANAADASTTFTMPKGAVKVTATYKDKPSGQYVISVTNGNPSVKSAKPGTKVTLTANPAPAGKVFDRWTVDTASTPVTIEGNTNETATFTMPTGDVAVTANYKDVFAITVTGGKANPATAAKGETVTITADAAPSGKVFDKWTIEGFSVAPAIIADETKSTTTFIMPGGTLRIKAVYKAATPSTPGGTVTTPSKPGSTTQTPSTSTPEKVNYEITTGKNAVWQLGGKEDLVIASTAPFEKFAEVKLGGVTLGKENYSVKSGSTVVTVKSSYLNTLKAGKYDFVIVSGDGTAATQITLSAATGVPKTADSGSMLPYMLLAILSAALGVAMKQGRKSLR